MYLRDLSNRAQRAVATYDVPTARARNLTYLHKFASELFASVRLPSGFRRARPGRSNNWQLQTRVNLVPSPLSSYFAFGEIAGKWGGKIARRLL